MSDLYRNIRNTRLTKDITQEEPAAKTGCKFKSSIAKKESGTSDIPQSKINAFAETLSVPVSDLMSQNLPDGMEPPNVTDDVVTFPVITDSWPDEQRTASPNAEEPGRPKSLAEQEKRLLDLFKRVPEDRRGLVLEMIRDAIGVWDLPR